MLRIKNFGHYLISILWRCGYRMANKIDIQKSQARRKNGNSKLWTEVTTKN
jgi:hypothetical protein